MKNSKLGVALVSIGGVLILAGLALVGYNYWESEHAGAESEAIVEEMLDVLDSEGLEDVPEPQAMVGGYECIGLLHMEDAGLYLPILSEWDFPRLRVAPCRHFGSVEEDNLVVAAHNYRRHFGGLKDMELGSMVTLTEMDGTVNTYALGRLETLNPTAVEEVQNSGYPLVLYTCTYGGKSRVVAFFDRVLTEDELPPLEPEEGMVPALGD